MKKSIVIFGFFLVLTSPVYAQEGVGDKIHEAAHNTAQGTKKVAHAIGQGVKTGAHKVAGVAKKVKGKVVDTYHHGRQALHRSNTESDASHPDNPH